MRAGATVGLIAPGSTTSPGAVGLSVKAVERYGFKVVVGRSCHGSDFERNVGIPFNDETRVKDLHDMYADPCIDGVMAIRGGYGCSRLLGLIDYDLIRRNPKPLFGYSDITALHTALGQRADVRTYHTPMPSELINKPDELTEGYFLRCLYEKRPFGAVLNPQGKPLAALCEGKREGALTGGNLSVIASLLGTPYEVKVKGKILFLEDINEPLYKIDRMFLQLRLAGKFRECAGVLLGSFTENGKEADSKVLKDIFKDHLRGERKPVIYGLACGHIMPTVSLPLGERVLLDADNKTVCT
jgi:muramoyltetrapeptide carboxypeptidase